MPKKQFWPFILAFLVLLILSASLLWTNILPLDWFSAVFNGFQIAFWLLLACLMASGQLTENGSETNQTKARRKFHSFWAWSIGVLFLANLKLTPYDHSLFGEVFTASLAVLVFSIAAFSTRRISSDLPEKLVPIAQKSWFFVLGVFLLKAVFLWGQLDNQLFFAVSENHPDEARLALKIGAKPTPYLLGLAVFEGRPEVVEVLLKAGVNPNAPDGDKPACYWAANHHGKETAKQRFETLRVILEAGADPNRIGGGPGEAFQKVLEWTDSRLRDQAIELLVRKGAKLDVAGPGAETVFMSATAKDDVGLMELLHKLGANIETPNADGETPFRSAAERGNWSALRWLMDKGANPNLKAKDGKTALENCEEGTVLTEMLKAYQKEYQAKKSVPAKKSE